MAPITSPSTELYSLGRGILTAGVWEGDTPPAENEFEDLGAVSEIMLTVEETKLEHFNFRTGLKTKDKVVTLESSYKGSFTCDEISQANLARFVKGTVAGNVIRANTALSKEYALTFDAQNPVGERQKWYFRRCKIAPNGDFSLISDNWGQLKFTFDGLADAVNYPDSPQFDVEYPTTTT
jgi:hypothetical protein